MKYIRLAEKQVIMLVGKSWILSGENPTVPQRVGLFTKLSLPNQLTLYWDGVNRLHLVAWVQWKEKVICMMKLYEYISMSFRSTVLFFLTTFSLQGRRLMWQL